jgi:hypothetical protein
MRQGPALISSRSATILKCLGCSQFVNKPIPLPSWSERHKERCIPDVHVSVPSVLVFAASSSSLPWDASQRTDPPAESPAMFYSEAVLSRDSMDGGEPSEVEEIAAASALAAVRQSGTAADATNGAGLSDASQQEGTSQHHAVHPNPFSGPSIADGLALDAPVSAASHTVQAAHTPGTTSMVAVTEALARARAAATTAEESLDIIQDLPSAQVCLFSMGYGLVVEAVLV